MYSFPDQILALLSGGNDPFLSQPILAAGISLLFIGVFARTAQLAGPSPFLPSRNGTAFAAQHRMTDAPVLQEHMAMIDLLPDEVYAFSADTFVVTYLNKRALHAAKCGLQSALGRPLAELFDRFDDGAFRAQAAAVLLGDDASGLFEMELRARPVEVHLHYERGLEGGPGFLAVIRDISHRKLVEQDMAEFVATVSHEIRAPMTSIKGALSLISAGVAGPVSERGQAMVDMAQRNVERLLRLINDLLDLQKLDAGMVDVALAPIDLVAFSQEVVSVNAGYGHEFGVELCCNGPQHPVFANLNRDGMMQAVTNLLSNAVKFSQQGQSVTLTVSELPDRVRLKVTDHGPGIPPEAHRTLFSRFVQAHAEIDRQRVGTGLGLSIAKAIVEKQGGSIGFSSELGLGSTFYIDLPKIEAPKAGEIA